jgi:flavin reductase (DIM6/NTAB) family NADH-FMN oxidoreductase RutF
MNAEPLPDLAPTAVLDLLPPFPIVLVTTRTNVLTVNQVTYCTFRPLRIGIAIAHARHSYGLLKAEGTFVINVPDGSMVETVKACGTLSGRDGDKFAAVGLDREPSLAVEAVSIASCGAHIECRVVRVVPFEHRDWFIGNVVAARKQTDHAGTSALLCGRHRYMLAQTEVALR